MNFLDAMNSYQNDAGLGTPPPGPPATAPMPGAPTPNIMDLLARAMQPPPQAQPLPQGDMSGIGPLALLRFASQVTQPRGYGQSTGNAILSSASHAAEYADAMKRQANDKAVQDLLTQQKMRESEARLRNDQVGTVAKVQEIDQATKRAPLELDALRSKIEASKSQNDLNALKIKVEKIREKYADEMAQADIRQKNARTDQERAAAALAREHAALYKKQAEELLTVAEMRSKGAGGKDWIRKEDGLGGRPLEFNRTTNETRPARFADTQSALEWAKREAKAMAEAGTLPAGEKEADAVKRLVKEAGPEGGSSVTNPAAPAPAAPLASSTPMAPPTAARNEVFEVDGKIYVTIDPGKPMKEISREEFNKRKRKNGPENNMDTGT